MKPEPGMLLWADLGQRLPRTSLVLLDQLQAMDPRCIGGYLGRLAPAEYEPMRASWRALFEL
ncbi:MAG TPA: hypothetical protein VIL11_00395 [Limnochordales bacterium]